MVSPASWLLLVLRIQVPSKRLSPKAAELSKSAAAGSRANPIFILLSLIEWLNCWFMARELSVRTIARRNIEVLRLCNLRSIDTCPAGIKLPHARHRAMDFRGVQGIYSEQQNDFTARSLAT